APERPVRQPDAVAPERAPEDHLLDDARAGVGGTLRPGVARPPDADALGADRDRDAAPGRPRPRGGRGEREAAAVDPPPPVAGRPGHRPALEVRVPQE